MNRKVIGRDRQTGRQTNEDEEWTKNSEEIKKEKIKKRQRRKDDNWKLENGIT